MTEQNKEIIQRLSSGELEIFSIEEKNPTEQIHSGMNLIHVCSDFKTVTITCHVRKSDKDRIEELKQENKEICDKLDSITKILD